MTAVILTHPALAAERVCHDEQLLIWAGNLVGRMSMAGWLRDDLSYDDGLDMHAAVKAEIKRIVEIAFTHPEALARGSKGELR